jgi:pilus assembly protein TadC
MARKKQDGTAAIALLGVGVLVFGALSFIAAFYFIVRCLFLPRHLTRKYLYPRDVQVLDRKIAELDKQIHLLIVTGRAYGLPIRVRPKTL